MLPTRSTNCMDPSRCLVVARTFMMVVLAVLSLSTAPTTAFSTLETKSRSAPMASRKPISAALLSGSRSCFSASQATTKETGTTLHAVNPAQIAATAAAAAPLASVAVLAFIVLIHELGHYSASKFFGVDVEEFSVGFGPKLLGFRMWGNDFNLRALPLGGYVRFPENYNATLAREVETAEYEEASAFLEGRREEMSMGAKVVNAVTLGALEDKLWNDEKRRRQALLNEQQQLSETMKTRWWSTFTAGRRKDRLALSKVPAEIEYYDDPNLLQNRPWIQRAVVLSGGVVFNLLLAFSIYFGQITLGPGLPVPVVADGIVVTQQPIAGAPARGILQQGDLIVAVDGKPVAVSTRGMSSSQKAISDFIAQIRATPDGSSLAIDVQHKGDSNRVEQVRVQPQRQGGPNGPKTIGVLLSPNYIRMDVLKTSNPVEAGRLALGYCTDLTVETTTGLLSFLSGLIVGGNSGTGAQVSGPIGLIKTGSDVVATQDWTAVLLFAAAISINLGVINSIPLPALDGGQLVFVLAEAVTGRKVNQRFQEGVTGVAVLFLLLLSAGTFVGDISSILGATAAR